MKFIRGRKELLSGIVSGYTDQIIARKGVLEPGQHFLAKPYTLDDLEQRLDELIGSR